MLKRNCANTNMNIILILGMTKETTPAVRPLGAKLLLDYMLLWVSFGLSSQQAMLKKDPFPSPLPTG